MITVRKRWFRSNFIKKVSSISKWNVYAALAVSTETGWFTDKLIIRIEQFFAHFASIACFIACVKILMFAIHVSYKNYCVKCGRCRVENILNVVKEKNWGFIRRPIARAQECFVIVTLNFQTHYFTISGFKAGEPVAIYRIMNICYQTTVPVHWSVSTVHSIIWLHIVSCFVTSTCT